MALLATALPTHAQTNPTGPDNVTVRFVGGVPPVCQIGGSTDTRGSFDLGVLIDTQTGLLRRNLAPPQKDLGDTWCNAPSQIEISAIELTPQGATAQLRSGFSNAIHYTATASGWTDTAATYRTDGATTQRDAVQIAPDPRVVPLVITASDFRLREGSATRPLASRAYLGAIRVTLRPLP